MSKKVAVSAMLVALAMIFSYVEVLIPVNFGVPGIKLGLANLVVIVGLYMLKSGEVFFISMIRIFLMGWMFGNGASIIYSLAGGVLSFLVMTLLKRSKGFSLAGISAAGGAAHNIGQILAAVWIMQNVKLFYYLPVLLAAGVITGVLLGRLSGRIMSAVTQGLINSWLKVS